jgi:hypothetical protein
MAANNLTTSPTVENFNTTLATSITSSDSTVQLTSVTGLQAPGWLVIDRVDANGNLKSVNSWEYIYFAGVSAPNITSVQRGLGGVGSAQPHSAGAVVESVVMSQQWRGLATVVMTAFPKDIGSQLLTSTVTVSTYLTASGASVVGIGGRDSFVWGVPGSLATALNGTGSNLHIAPGLTNIRSVAAVLMTPASGASVVIDIRKNGTSVFTAATRPAIAGGGTFVSTASIGTKNLEPGNILSLNVDTIGTNATFPGAQLTVMVKTD